MSKNEPQNTFYYISWEVNTFLWWNLVSVCNIKKKKLLLKTSQKNIAWKVVPGLFVYKRFNYNLLESEFFKTSWLYWMRNRKTIRMDQNRQVNIHKFLFKKHTLKIKKVLKLYVFRVYSVNSEKLSYPVKCISSFLQI